MPRAISTSGAMRLPPKQAFPHCTRSYVAVWNLPHSASLHSEENIALPKLRSKQQAHEASAPSWPIPEDDLRSQLREKGVLSYEQVKLAKLDGVAAQGAAVSGPSLRDPP